MTKKKKQIDITGKQFGKWTVLKKDIEKSKEKKKSYWVCQCSCKNKTIKSVYYYSLINGDSSSCGCQSKEFAKEQFKKYNFFELYEDYAIGKMFNGKEFIIDIDDYEKVKNICWHIANNHVVANNSNKIYANTNKKTFSLHEYILNFPELKKGIEIDHIDKNPLNNRKNNLRIVTHKENTYNMPLKKNNTSGYIGVSWRKDTQKWTAFICIDKKKINLGCFDNIEEAIKVRLKAELFYFEKEYAPQRHLFKKYNII